MSMAINYQDVINQLESAGLDTSQFAVNTSKVVRCMVDCERGRKGWYWLHEIALHSGEIAIVGNYGIWHGNDNGSQTIALPRSSKATAEDNALVRKRIIANKKKMAEQLRREQEKAAARAVQKWRAMSDTGESGYLTRKKVDAIGIRFTKDGAIAVPMLDVAGKVHGLQFILDRDNPAHKERIRKLESDKRFWPTGLAMQGHFHLIGRPDPGGIMLVTEGYATGASLHMATGLPVFVVFSANNILPVLLNLEKHYKRARFLICADDDYLCRCQHCKHQVPVADADGQIVPCSNCGEAHGKINTGVTVAINAAMTIDNAEWIRPIFTDRTDLKTGKPVKWTDFNDLHVQESLQAVEAQIDAALQQKFPTAGKAKPSARDAQHRGAGKAVPSYMSVDDAMLRYSLIYGVKDTMFDHHLYKLVPKSCVLDILPDHAWREMKTRDDRRVYDITEVGFDPAETDQNIKCNLWGGWPTQPAEGCCDKLLELLEYLCSGEDKPREVYRWILRWLAYPIQHPGAKMKTALVVHGAQGVGKNMLFEAVMAIYGEYGRVIGQSELEEKFNEWASRKLFLIANEVIARQELFHQKNKIKALITDDWIHINPKNVAAHDERNHINLVFLSNEAQPVVLDADDRRFMAIWTPPKREPEFYRAVLDEIAHGGVAALHDYLLNLDLGDFNPGTPPMNTRARINLIEISKESPDRFIDAWQRGELDQACQACALADLYDVYTRWCRREGERFAYTKIRFSSRISMREDMAVMRKPVMQPNGKPKVTSVVLPDDDPKPDGETWMSWLAARVSEFSRNIADSEAL